MRDSNWMLAVTGDAWERKDEISFPELSEDFSIFNTTGFFMLWWFCSRFRGKEGNLCVSKLFLRWMKGQWALQNRHQATRGKPQRAGRFQEAETKVATLPSPISPPLGTCFSSPALMAYRTSIPHPPLSRITSLTRKKAIPPLLATYSAGTKKKSGRKQQTAKVRPCS